MGRSRSRERRSRRSRSRDRREDVTEEKDDPEFRVGRRVMVHGLQKNPEKNGAIGILREYNSEKGRWNCELALGSNNFKEENLELLPDNKHVDGMRDSDIPTAKLYISGLAAETVDTDLINLFQGVGVLQKEPPKDSRGNSIGFQDTWPPAVKLYKPGTRNGDGTVEYMDKVAAKAAIKTYNGYRLKGAKIRVDFAGAGRKYEARELTRPWAEREENLSKLKVND
mmetsp:Transcript_84143/g.132870  ORF Transcript_84143/g.132870 Transcript_84143/m.132870 type:complete len:225 (+) Transcript_84143:60-734(+)